MRMSSLVSVGLVAALIVACKKEAKDTGGTSAATGSAVGSATAGSAAAAAPSPAGSITFKYKVDAVGSKWNEEEHQRMELDIEGQGERAKMVQEKRKATQTEVLAVSADAVTKAKITYGDILEKQTIGDKSKDKPAPHAGKTYVLEVDGGAGLKVSTADGAPVSAEEEAVIKEDEDSFGKPEKMGRALDGMTFELGKRVEIPAERAQGAFGENDNMRVETLALTLTKVEGDEAWFDLEMTGAGDAGKGATIKIQVKGPVHIDLTVAKPLEMTLQGTVEMSGAATAKGTITMSGKRAKG